MPTQESRRKELTELIEQFDTAMVVTFAPDHRLHARPMAIAGHDDPLSTIYFVTDSDAPKVREIAAEPTGLITLQDSSRFVSMAGEFAVDHTTRSEIESLWSPKWRVWFADEEAAAGLGVLRFVIGQAEYWDRSGLYRWQILWRTGKALMTDEQIDDQQLPGHARVDLTRDSG